MGKADQKRTQNAITKSVDANQQMASAGINESLNRVNQLTTRSDDERAAIRNYYSSAANGGRDYYGSIKQAPISTGGEETRPTGGGGGGNSGGGSGGSGGGGGTDYMSIWQELGGKDGGFDPTRLGNISNIAKQLANTSGNYGNTDSAMKALMAFAQSGGVDDATRKNINRDSLLEFEKTGGYSDRDKNLIRSRANSAISSQYGAMQDEMKRRRAVNNMGPGWDRAQFKLARQGAQAGADTARDTELGIMDSVRSGRMDAAKTLASNNLSLADLTSRNTLAGYQGAGDLDIRKQAGINDALGSSANIDLQTQGTINNTRLGAASGMSQDANQKASISASSSAAAAAREDANRRWAAEMEQRDREFGASGMLSMYQAAPTELLANQEQLMGYRKYASGNYQDEINNRINASTIPGVGSSIAKGLGIAGNIAGMATGGLGGLAKFGGITGGRQYAAPNQNTPQLMRYGM